jgi:hypothetical protein
MNENPARQQLEKDLIEKSEALRKVRFEAQSKHTWVELGRYYRNNEEIDIHVMLLDSCYTFTYYLREALIECAASQQPNEDLEEASSRLEAALENFLFYAASNYYRQEAS